MSNVVYEETKEYQGQMEQYYRNILTGTTSKCVSCGEEHNEVTPECVPCVLGIND